MTDAEEVGPRGPVHAWLPNQEDGTLCGLRTEPGMVGTERSLQLVTCPDCERVIRASYRAISDHAFRRHPWGHDCCDAKLDDHGRPRTCARPLREHLESET